MYSKVGRPSIPPEQLLRALLLQMLYSVRSERLLVEEIDYNILFRWFVGLNLDDEVWDATVFTKNRDRLLEAEVAKEFLSLVVEQARGQGWASDEHFTVDGSLLEAWAGVKSFQPKNKKSSSPPDDPGNPTVDYRGEKRSNETHESKSDPEAQMARKGPGKEAKLSYSGESAGGESQRVDCGQPGVGSHGHGGALCGAGNAAGTSGKQAGDGGWRQGLRHGGFRARVSEPMGDAACGAKPWAQRWQRHR